MSSLLVPSPKQLHFSTYHSTVNSAPHLNIQVNGVKKLLFSQKPQKASGPDHISPRFLKEMASPIAPALTLIYQASYEKGQIPDNWKRAFVTPLCKKGDKNKASNYRRVSLISCCSTGMRKRMASHGTHSARSSYEVSGEQQDSERLPAYM